MPLDSIWAETESHGLHIFRTDTILTNPVAGESPELWVGIPPCSWNVSTAAGVEMLEGWLSQHHGVLGFRESLSTTLGLGKCSLRCVGLKVTSRPDSLIFSMKTGGVFEITSEIQYPMYLQLYSSWKNSPVLVHLGWWKKGNKRIRLSWWPTRLIHMALPPAHAEETWERS